MGQLGSLNKWTKSNGVLGSQLSPKNTHRKRPTSNRLEDLDHLGQNLLGPSPEGSQPTTGQDPNSDLIKNSPINQLNHVSVKGNAILATEADMSHCHVTSLFSSNTQPSLLHPGNMPALFTYNDTIVTF